MNRSPTRLSPRAVANLRIVLILAVSLLLIFARQIADAGWSDAGLAIAVALTAYFTFTAVSLAKVIIRALQAASAPTQRRIARVRKRSAAFLLLAYPLYRVIAPILSLGAALYFLDRTFPASFFSGGGKSIFDFEVMTATKLWSELTFGALPLPTIALKFNGMFSGIALNFGVAVLCITMIASSILVWFHGLFVVVVGQMFGSGAERSSPVTKTDKIVAKSTSVRVATMARRPWLPPPDVGDKIIDDVESHFDICMVAPINRVRYV